MSSRQQLLIGLLAALGGRVHDSDFQGLLFLYCREFTDVPAYDFVPCRGGARAFQTGADKRALTKLGWLEPDEDWRLARSFDEPPPDAAALARLNAAYGALQGARLQREIGHRHAGYTTRSEPGTSEPGFFTIGYEGRSLDSYLNRLVAHDVATLIDVRHNPQSRKYGFSKRPLAGALAQLGIAYLHLPELGIASARRHRHAPSEHAQLLDDYERDDLPHLGVALAGIRERALADRRVAITCFEADPCQCHRGRIANALRQEPGWHLPVRHL